MIYLLNAKTFAQIEPTERSPAYCRCRNISQAEAALLIAKAWDADNFFLIEDEAYGRKITRALDLKLSEMPRTTDLSLGTLTNEDQLIIYYYNYAQKFMFMNVQFEEADEERVKEIERDFQIGSIEVRFPAKGGRDL